MKMSFAGRKTEEKLLKSSDLATFESEKKSDCRGLALKKMTTVMLRIYTLMVFIELLPLLLFVAVLVLLLLFFFMN